MNENVIATSEKFSIGMTKISLLAVAVYPMLTFGIQPAVSLPAQRDLVPLPDPFVLLHEDVYYAYGTIGDSKPGLPVFVSHDLVSWKEATAPALAKADSFGRKWFWAPEVFYRRENQTFYMFYSADNRLCVATAKSPLGPFKQAAKQPMWQERAIDSTLFVDDDGTPWLFFVHVIDRQYSIWVVELERTWLEFKTGKRPSRCFGPEQDWETISGHVTEGPSVLKHDGVYYLIYTANGYRSQDYAIGYATASSPIGPWKKASSNPILKKPRPGIVGTGHGAPFLDKNNRLHYVFHAHAAPGTVHPRKMYFARMSFDKAGGLSIDKNSITIPRLAPLQESLQKQAIHAAQSATGN